MMTSNRPPSPVFTLKPSERKPIRKIDSYVRKLSKVSRTCPFSACTMGTEVRRRRNICPSTCISTSQRLCKGQHRLHAPKRQSIPLTVSRFPRLRSGRRPYSSRLAQALRTAFRRTDEALLSDGRLQMESAKEESSGAAAAVAVLMVLAAPLLSHACTHTNAISSLSTHGGRRFRALRMLLSRYPGQEAGRRARRGLPRRALPAARRRHRRRRRRALRVRGAHGGSQVRLPLPARPPPAQNQFTTAHLPRARRRPDAHPRARPARAPAEKVAAGSNGPPLSVGQVLEHAGAGAGAAAGGLVGLRPAQLHPRGLAGLRCGTSPHARARTHARTHQITRTHTPTRTRGRAHAQAVDLLLLEGARERSCGCRAPPPPLHHHHHAYTHDAGTEGKSRVGAMKD